MSPVETLRPLPPVTGTPVVKGSPETRPPKDVAARQDFSEILQQEITPPAPLNFSAHAQTRLISRDIQLSNQQMARLEQGVKQAATKGAKDSLVMMDNLAFIVSVANRTVVTAVDRAAGSGNVFTQIDSAVIV